jgi:hypothetical protein
MNESQLHDLSLSQNDAENVIGGTKKKSAKHQAHRSASADIILNAPPLAMNPSDTSMQDAPQGDDPDC